MILLIYPLSVPYNHLSSIHRESIFTPIRKIDERLINKLEYLNYEVTQYSILQIISAI